MSESLKKKVILSFASSLSADGLEKNHIILTTSAGLISGKPCLQKLILMKRDKMARRCQWMKSTQCYSKSLANTLREMSKAMMGTCC